MDTPETMDDASSPDPIADLKRRLEEADPADAPEIAEDLARTLGGHLEPDGSTNGEAAGSPTAGTQL